jgi:hypothetical protein
MDGKGRSSNLCVWGERAFELVCTTSGLLVLFSKLCALKTKRLAPPDPAAPHRKHQQQ